MNNSEHSSSTPPSTAEAAYQEREIQTEYGSMTMREPVVKKTVQTENGFEEITVVDKVKATSESGVLSAEKGKKGMSLECQGQNFEIAQQRLNADLSCKQEFVDKTYEKAQVDSMLKQMNTSKWGPTLKHAGKIAIGGLMVGASTLLTGTGVGLFAAMPLYGLGLKLGVDGAIGLVQEFGGERNTRVKLAEDMVYSKNIVQKRMHELEKGLAVGEISPEQYTEQKLMVMRDMRDREQKLLLDQEKYKQLQKKNATTRAIASTVVSIAATGVFGSPLDLDMNGASHFVQMTGDGAQWLNNSAGDVLSRAGSAINHDGELVQGLFKMTAIALAGLTLAEVRQHTKEPKNKREGVKLSDLIEYRTEVVTGRENIDVPPVAQRALGEVSARVSGEVNAQTESGILNASSVEESKPAVAEKKEVGGSWFSEDQLATLEFGKIRAQVLEKMGMTPSGVQVDPMEYSHKIQEWQKTAQGADIDRVRAESLATLTAVEAAFKNNKFSPAEGTLAEGQAKFRLNRLLATLRGPFGGLSPKTESPAVRTEEPAKESVLGNDQAESDQRIIDAAREKMRQPESSVNWQGLELIEKYDGQDPSQLSEFLTALSQLGSPELPIPEKRASKILFEVEKHLSRIGATEIRRATTKEQVDKLDDLLTWYHEDFLNKSMMEIAQVRRDAGGNDALFEQRSEDRYQQQLSRLQIKLAKYVWDPMKKGI